MIKKALDWITQTLLLFVLAFLDPFVLIALLVGIPLGLWIHAKYLHYLNNSPESPWVDILVEAHGLVFDILFFTIILGVYTFFVERKRKIKSYEDEIDDYRGWEEKEAMYRISGSIRRLNRERRSALTLYRCYLEGANLMGANLERTKASRANFQEADLKFANFKYADLGSVNMEGAILMGADLSGTDLVEANLQNADLGLVKLYKSDLRGANFQGADLREADLGKVDLSHANLKEANLRGVNFQGADLSNASLEGARVDSLDWIEALKKSNVKGVLGIEKQYYVVPHENHEGFIIIEIKQSEIRQQCVGIAKKSGKRCKRLAQLGSDRCFQHREN